MDIKNGILRPFRENLSYTAGFTAMSMVAPAILCAANSYPKLFVQILPWHLAAAYVAVLAAGALKAGTARRRVAMCVVFALFFLSSCADAFYSASANWLFDTDSVALVLATTASEASEFFSTYLSGRMLLTAVLSVGAYALCRLVLRRIRPGRGLAVACVGCLAACMVAETALYGPLKLTTPKVMCALTMPGRLMAFATAEIPGPVEPCGFTAKMQQDKAPDVVVIIGESLNRDHCRLYGYDKPTTPRLSAMPDSVLIRFSRVKAAESHTQEAFMRIMSLGGNGSEPENTWRTLPSLPDIARAAGYTTLWLSNQSRYGAYENVPSRFAERCDSAAWVSDMYLGLKSATLDGELATALKAYLASRPDSTGRLMAIVHCMGSHFKFDERYDRRQSPFSPDSYGDRPAHQRENLAHYDNSVAYTDSVVAEIMHSMDGRDALVLFFPDHGFDIYQSSPDALIHVREGSDESLHASRDIPFVAYTTEGLRRRYPAIVQELREMSAQPFCTDAFTPALMSLLGIEVELRK